MKKLIHFLNDTKNTGWSDLQYCCRTIKPQISRSLKNLLIRYSIFSLLTIFSIFGIFKIIERQIKIKTQIRISQILQEIQTAQKVIEAHQAREDAREVAIKKVSEIIIRYTKIDSAQIRIYANEIYEMTLKYDNLDLELITATITHESGWNSKIKSPVGAMGLMQIMPETGKMLVGKERMKWTNKKDILFNPITNIRLGSRYLSGLITKYSSFLVKIQDEVVYVEDNNNIHLGSTTYSSFVVKAPKEDSYMVVYRSREYAVEAALAAYNGGESRVAYALGMNNSRVETRYLWRETRTYIPRVLGLYDKYLSM